MHTKTQDISIDTSRPLSPEEGFEYYVRSCASFHDTCCPHGEFIRTNSAGHPRWTTWENEDARRKRRAMTFMRGGTADADSQEYV